MRARATLMAEGRGDVEEHDPSSSGRSEGRDEELTNALSCDYETCRSNEVPVVSTSTRQRATPVFGTKRKLRLLRRR